MTTPCQSVYMFVFGLHYWPPTSEVYMFIGVERRGALGPLLTKKWVAFQTALMVDFQMI